MKIAQALLLRKQLDAKVKQLTPLKLQGDQGLFETKVKRVNVTDQADEVSITTPKITLGEVTKEYDKYATSLRKLDAALQQANWQYDLPEFDEDPFAK